MRVGAFLLCGISKIPTVHLSFSFTSEPTFVVNKSNRTKQLFLMIFLTDDWVRWEEVVKTVVAMVLTVTIVMVLDYWWLNLQSLAVITICNFGRSGISIGEDGLSIGEVGDGYKLVEGDSDGSVGDCGSNWSGC